MKFKILICISILLAGCSNLKSDEKVKTTDDLYKNQSNYLESYGKSLSLDESIYIARERNLDIKSKNLESQIATLDRKIAFGNFLPSIGITGNYNVKDSAISLDNPLSGSLSGPLGGDIGFLDKEAHSFGVTAQMPIFVPSIWYLYSARKKGEDISKMVESLTDKMIQLQVMNQYYYIMALESKKNMLKADIDTAIELERKGKNSLTVETILPWQYNKLDVNVKNKEFLLNENSRKLKIAKMNFMKTLNLNPMTDFELEKIEGKNYSNLTLEDAIYSALNQNENIKISQEGNKISEDQKKIAITNFLPKIMLGGGYVNNSNSVLSDPDFLFGSVSGIVSVFNGFKNINEYKKSVKLNEISELKLEKEYLKIIVETANAYTQVESSNELIKLTDLNHRVEKEKLNQKKNEEMLGSIDEVEYLSAVSSYEKSWAQLQQAEYRYEVSQGSLKIAMGENPIKEEKKDEREGN